VLVRVLGPVTVHEAGILVPLPGPIPTRILALLTTNLASGLRTAELIDGVWGDAATAAAHATLQSHVVRLRRAIGPSSIVTTAYGYRLALPPAAVDAHQFVTAAAAGAALLADGRAVAAGSVLREALELWRGEAYDGLDDCGLLASERMRLAQLQLDALLQRMEADLATNPTRALVAELEAALETSPTNERVWALLVQAWHAVGDTATALAVFDRARTRLLDELGLEPGAALRAVQGELLRASTVQAPKDPVRRGERRRVLVVAVSEPRADLDPEVDLASRSSGLATVTYEVERLDGSLVRHPGAITLAVFGAVTAREDDAERALLCGRRIAEATGARVGVASGLGLVTTDLDQLGVVADRAVAQALKAAPGEVVTDLVTDADGADRADRPAREPVPFVGRQKEIERLTMAVRDAERQRRAVVVPVIAEAGLGKSRLLAEVRRRCEEVDWFQAQCDALGTRGGLDPLVDAFLQRADFLPPSPGSRAETIADWAAALTGLARDGVVVLCVEDAHWASELLLDLIDDLASAPVQAALVIFVTARPEIETRRPAWLATTRPMRLAALGQVETTQLVDAVLAQTGADDVDGVALAAASGGVPLFAVELGRALAVGAGQRIPHHLSDLMAARIDSLDPAVRDVMADAAVVGSTFWAEAVGADGTAIEALLRREFIREVHPSAVPGMHEYRFRHDLLRDAAYARLLRPDRAAGHLAAARWWQGLGRAQDAAIIAEHAWLAHESYGEAGLPDQAAELALTASRSAAAAARGVDTAAATTFLQRAATLLADRPDEAAVLVDLAWALSENRLLTEADAVVRRARALVDPSDGPSRISAAFLALQLDFALGRPHAPEILHQLLADFPTGPIHIRALGVLAVNMVISQTTESFARALEVSDTAIAMACDLGDEDAAVLSFSTRGRARLALGDERGLADMDRAQERGPGLLPPFVVLGTRQWYAGAAHHWSGPAAELRIREDLEDYAWRTGMEFLVSFGVAERLRCLWELGRPEECVAEADRIDRRSEAMTRWVVVQRALALTDLGRLDDGVLAEVLATPPADDTDLRHLIGTAVVHTRHALARGDASVAASVLTGLGDLTAYAARDGSAEFLPRILRLAAEAGLEAFGAELSDVTFEPTPLGRALTGSVRGLVRRDPTLLLEAVSAWELLGDSVDLQLARSDAGLAISG
jgi:DNA-binding SARP family transcriptional activator